MHPEKITEVAQIQEHGMFSLFRTGKKLRNIFCTAKSGDQWFQAEQAPKRISPVQSNPWTIQQASTESPVNSRTSAAFGAPLGAALALLFLSTASWFGWLLPFRARSCEPMLLGECLRVST